MRISRHHLLILSALLCWLGRAVDLSAQAISGPAEIRLQRAGENATDAIELGQQLQLDIIVSPGTDPVTGYTFFLAFDSQVFSLVPAAGDSTDAEPFTDGDFLSGVTLLNRIESSNGQTVLSFAEAAGVQREAVTEEGIAASVVLDVVRRPLGDETTLELLATGRDRMSHYTSSVAPGAEQQFGSPLGSMSLRVTGFQIQQLPDTTVVEGAGNQVVFDNLDQFVDQIGAQVIWSASFIDGLNTTIEADGRVTMRPEGIVGERQVVFTAFEVGEGNEDIDTVNIRVLSPPRIAGFPPTITFAEDGFSDFVQLDDVVSDLDHLDGELVWTASGSSFASVNIDEQRRALFSAAADSFGEAQIQLVVADPSGLSDTITTQIIVTAVNDGPQVLRRDPVYPRLGVGGEARIPLEDLIVDADDALTSLNVELLSDPGVSAELSADGTELIVRGDAAGRGLVQIGVSDTEESADGRLVAIVLEDAQTVAPQISNLAPLRFLQGTTGTLDLTDLATDDSPGDALFWTPVAPAELKPSVTGMTLLVSAQPDFTGNSTLVLLVTDPELNQDSATLPVIVLPNDEPAAPLVQDLPKIGLVSGMDESGEQDQVVLSLDELIDDPDTPASQITWSVSASSGLTAQLDPTRREVTLTAQDGLAGVGALTLTATDPEGLEHTRSIPVLVSEPGGDPVLNTPDPVVLEDTGDEGRIDLDDLVFDDEDFDSELFWSVQAADGVDANLDPVNHLLRVQRSDDAGGGGSPSEALLLLTVEDTRGQSQSQILTVQLPPVFDIGVLPEVTIFPGGTDSSLVLNDHVMFEADPVTLTWQIDPPVKITAVIDTSTLRVHISSSDPGFIGSELLRFTATDPSGRSRTASARVNVRGRGLAPQVRALPSVLVRAGEENKDVDLDDFVVDDDPDSSLTWSVSRPADVMVEVDSLTHIVTVVPSETASGPRTAQLLVRDPAGNTDLALLEITVLRGGDPPVIGELPQVLLIAGTPEQALNLDLFATDGDTPIEDLTWLASAEPGVSARVDGHRLLVSVPAGQQGVRRVLLAAVDPQGNRDEAPLTILIQQDDEAPGISLQARRNALTPDELAIEIVADEDLRSDPEVQLNGISAPVEALGDGMWRVTYPIPAISVDQLLTVEVMATDPAGNQTQRQAEIILRRVGADGGSALTPDQRANVNVPDAVARPGRIVVLRPMDTQDLPAGAADGGQVYELDIAAGEDLNQPVTLSLFAGSSIFDPTQGIQRWDPEAEQWEDVPVAIDTVSAWMSTNLRRPGLYRRGAVSPDARREARRLSNYPNPFGSSTQIEYEVTREGAIRLEIYNVLGQRVRLLVDDARQEEGLWVVEWDGLSDEGLRLGSGVYYYQFREAGGVRLRSMLLLRGLTQ